MITEEDLSTTLHYIASDYFKGREGGTWDERMMASYLATSYTLLNIPGINEKDNSRLERYFQNFKFKHRGIEKSSQNVIAVLEGSDPVLKKEAIIIVAHYDHLGKDTTLKGDQIYNGAADDGSGTVALLQMAKSFATARDKGIGPKRTIIFFHAGAEEKGVRGSAYYARFPLWPLEKTTAVINLDGVGGIDVNNLAQNTNYVYVLHPDSTSRHLFEKTEKLNQDMGIKLEILYPKNASSFNSDNNSFQFQLVPSIYFSTGLTEHYHKVSDEAGTIDYKHMSRIVKLIFALSWDLSHTAVIKSTFSRSAYVRSPNEYYCPPCGCGKDDIIFDKPGECDACTMTLAPVWKRKADR